MKKINKYDWVRVWIVYKKKPVNAIVVDKLHSGNTFIVYIPDDDFYLYPKGIFSDGSKHYIGIVKSDIVEVYE